MSNQPEVTCVCEECGLINGEHHPDCLYFDTEKFSKDLTDVIMALHASLFGDRKNEEEPK